jgi:hypothetical protein
VVLEVVLSSVPTWVGVVAALTVIGIYDAIEAPVRERPLEPQRTARSLLTRLAITDRTARANP